MANLKYNLNQTLDFSQNTQVYNTLIDSYLNTPFDILNSISDLIILYNTHLEVVWANQSAQLFFANENVKLEKTKCNQVCTANGYCDQCSVKQSFDTKQICENEIGNTDGSAWLNTAIPLIDHDKNVKGVLEIRKELNNQIVHRTGKAIDFKGVATFVTDIQVRLDVEGNCLYVSPGFRKIIDNRFVNIMGLSFTEFVIDDDVLLTINALERVMLPPHLVNFECRMKTIDGFRWFSWSCKSMLDENNNVSSVVFSGKDITKQKTVEHELRNRNQAYEKLNEELVLQNENYEKITRELLKRNNQVEDLYVRLKESEERFRNMFVKHSSIMFLYDPVTYEIIDANFAAQHYYGYTEDEMCSKTLTDLNILSKEEIEQRFKKAQERGHQYVAFKHKLADGGIRDVEVYSVPILYKDEEVNFSIVYDVTKRKKAEKKLTESKKKLKAANDSKDKFFSIIAHDLRNPFNSLIGLTDYLDLNGETLSGEQLKELVRTMGEVSRQGYNLLENLLQWSRAQMGNLKVNVKPLVIHDIVKETASLLRNNASAKGIKIKIKACEKLKAFADENMIATVIRNLLANAIKYSYRNGIIEVHCSSSKDEVFVSVIDKGRGIDAEDQYKLFRIDENLSTPGTEKEAGTGLGLILCKEFIDRCKGKLSVVSAPGEGSTFTFSLPLAK